MEFDLPSLVALLALVASVSVLAYLRLSKRGSRRAKKRAKRAVRGEAKAARLLIANGYAIEDSQARDEALVRIDGALTRFEVRADYIVTRGGRRWVAEVKTGDIVTRLAHGPTRRQLLEYTMAFDAHGVLLVTPEDGQIREVAFPDRNLRLLLSKVLWFTLGLGGGALLTTWLGGL